MLISLNLFFLRTICVYKCIIVLWVISIRVLREGSNFHGTCVFTNPEIGAYCRQSFHRIVISNLFFKIPWVDFTKACQEAFVSSGYLIHVCLSQMKTLLSCSPLFKLCSSFVTGLFIKTLLLYIHIQEPSLSNGDVHIIGIFWMNNVSPLFKNTIILYFWASYLNNIYSHTFQDACFGPSYIVVYE